MVADQSLAAAFLAAAPEGRRELFESFPQLGAFIERVHRGGQIAYPDTDVDPDAFAAHLGATLREDEGLDAFDDLRGDELYLAYAVASGSHAALVAFENEYGKDIDRGFERLETGEQGADDLAQIVRQKLIVGTSQRSPKLLDYGGRGALRQWLRVTVVRMRADVVRDRNRKRSKPQPDDDRVLGPSVVSDDPEMAYFKAHYGDAMREAFQRAVDQLTPKQRNVLHQYWVERLSSLEIADLFSVHRATAKRWIADARTALLKSTRQHLSLELRLSRQEFESIVRMVESQLELSVVRLLAEAQDAGDDSGR